MPPASPLRELGYDRFGRSLTGGNARSLRAVSLGPYQDERVRALAHGVKDGHGVALDVAAAAMAKALEGTPVSKNAVLVGMPGHKGYGGSAQRLAKRLSELSGIPYADALASGEHESLYEWKKEHPGEELPELFFTEDGRPSSSTMSLTRVIPHGPPSRHWRLNRSSLLSAAPAMRTARVMTSGCRCFQRVLTSSWVPCPMVWD